MILDHLVDEQQVRTLPTVAHQSIVSLLHVNRVEFLRISEVFDRFELLLARTDLWVELLEVEDGKVLLRIRDQLTPYLVIVHLIQTFRTLWMEVRVVPVLRPELVLYVVVHAVWAELVLEHLLAELDGPLEQLGVDENVLRARALFDEVQMHIALVLFVVEHVYLFGLEAVQLLQLAVSFLHSILAALLEHLVVLLYYYLGGCCLVVVD